jgi:palmitoyl-protein thioesterase
VGAEQSRSGNSPLRLTFPATSHIPFLLPAFVVCAFLTICHKQAQYFRDTDHFERYIDSNHFLASINNELPAPHKDSTYAAHLKQLDTLVLVRFKEDVTVVPKESAWFGSYRLKEEEDDSMRAFFEPGRDEEVMKAIVPMRKQPLYVEDWIGLRALDESGRLELVSCKGVHMHLSTECWRPLVEKYVGSHP